MKTGAKLRAYWGRAALLATIVVACATPKAPLSEPQTPGTFATIVVRCPAVLAEKDRETRGVFTTEATLSLTFVATTAASESAAIDDPCHREARPIHVPPGDVKLDARYEERVRKGNSAVEARVGCELPAVAKDLKAGATYVYTVEINRRDANGKFNACSVKLAEVQAVAPTGSSSSSAAPAESGAAP